MGILARMRGLAARGKGVDRAAVDGLGASALAIRGDWPGAMPAGAVKVEAADGAAWVVHAAPLQCFLTPFAAAPELGLRLDYCFDPSGNRSRFALLLAAEGDSLLPTAHVATAMQEAVQAALQIGTLDLPPCTSDEEWHAFRAGLNELVYTRFGLVVEDCVPVDLHPSVDFAADLSQLAVLGARPVAQAATQPRPVLDEASDPEPVSGKSAAIEGAFAAGGASSVAGRREPWLAWGSAEDVPFGALRAAAKVGAMASAIVRGGAQDAQPDDISMRAPARSAPAATKPASATARTGNEAFGSMGASAKTAPLEPGDGRVEDALSGAMRAAAEASVADAVALRRLFLELPALAAGLRALPLTEGDGTFAPLQDILRRLALAAVYVNTMPSLSHTAPGQRLPKEAQQLRTAYAQSALSAMDEGWALLASMRSGVGAASLDDLDRILSNLEHSLAARRATAP